MSYSRYSLMLALVTILSKFILSKIFPSWEKMIISATLLASILVSSGASLPMKNSTKND